MRVTITDAARERLRGLALAKAELPATPPEDAGEDIVTLTPMAVPRVRLGLRAGGCAGFEQYLDFAPLVAEDDAVIDADGLQIICDKKSAISLNDCNIDWIDTPFLKKLQITFPGKKNECSCGTSFTYDISR